MKLKDLIYEKRIIGKLPSTNEINVAYIFLKNYKMFRKDDILSYRGTHSDQHLYDLVGKFGIDEDEFGDMFGNQIVTGGFVNSKGTFFNNYDKIIREDKNVEIKKLRDEYYSIKKKSFVDRQDLQRMEEIYRTLYWDYSYEIPKDENEWGIDKSKTARQKPKFRKSQRVTSFTRDRR